MKFLVVILFSLICSPAYAAPEPSAALSLHPPITAPVDKEKKKEEKPIVMPVVVTATAAEVTEGPVIVDDRGNKLHPLQLIGESRDKRAHWYTPKFGTKHYLYRVAENKYHYKTTKKIALVHDPRPWSKKHPIVFGAYEITRISAGAVITGAFTVLSVR